MDSWTGTWQSIIQKWTAVLWGGGGGSSTNGGIQWVFWASSLLTMFHFFINRCSNFWRAIFLFFGYWWDENLLICYSWAQCSFSINWCLIKQHWWWLWKGWWDGELNQNLSVLTVLFFVWFTRLLQVWRISATVLFACLTMDAGSSVIMLHFRCSRFVFCCTPLSCRV